MGWIRFEDTWGERRDVTCLSLTARWHLQMMIARCSRTGEVDGSLRRVDAERCSDVAEPREALRELVAAGHARVCADGDVYVIANINEHLPPAYLRSDRPRRQPIAPDLRLAIYQRDSWSCQDCDRQFVAKTARESSGHAAPADETGPLALDHIVPWSAGGPDEFENLRALCTPCNSRKGAHMERL